MRHVGSGARASAQGLCKVKYSCILKVKYFKYTDGADQIMWFIDHTCMRVNVTLACVYMPFVVIYFCYSQESLPKILNFEAREPLTNYL